MANGGIRKTKKQRGKHSCPSTSGKQNLSKIYIKKNTDKEGSESMNNILGAMNNGRENKQEYKGLWTNELLEAEICDYFTYCAENDMKPAKAGLRLWLGVSKSQYWEWENNNSKHQNKSNLLGMASDFMEMQYISNGEKHPTMNIFLLKSSHEHQDKQDIQITSGTDVSSAEIANVVGKLGLDKTE